MKTTLIAIALFIAKPPIFAQLDTFFDNKGQVLEGKEIDFFEKRKAALIGHTVRDFVYWEAAYGERVALGDFSGRVRVLYFGDIWHDQSIVDFAALNILMEKYQPRGLRTIAVTANQRTDFAGRLEAKNFLFPILTDAGATMMAEETGSRFGYPRVLLLGRDGLVVAVLPNSKNGNDPVKIAADWGAEIEPILFGK